jgi:hypothetical protein
MKQPRAFTSPKLHDAVVQGINTELESLTYIDYLYPIVHTSFNEDGETYPSIYMNDGSFKSYMIFPDNRVRAFTFFEIDEAAVPPKVDDDDIEYSLSLVFWGNLERINTTKKYDYTGEMLNDVIKVLGNLDAYDITYSTNTDEIFDNYTLYKEEEKQTLLRPNTGFKITFKIKGTATCWTE